MSVYDQTTENQQKMYDATIIPIMIENNVEKILKTKNWSEFYDGLCLLNNSLVPLNKSTEEIIKTTMSDTRIKNLWDHYIKFIDIPGQQNLSSEGLPRFLLPWLWFQHNKKFFNDKDREICEKFMPFDTLVKKLRDYDPLFDFMEVLSPASQFLSQSQMHILRNRYNAITREIWTLGLFPSDPTPWLFGKILINPLLWFHPNKNKMYSEDRMYLENSFTGALNSYENTFKDSEHWKEIGKNPSHSSFFEKDRVRTFLDDNPSLDRGHPPHQENAYMSIISHFTQIINRDLPVMLDCYCYTSKKEIEETMYKGDNDLTNQKVIRVIILKYRRNTDTGSDIHQKIEWRIENHYIWEGNHCKDMSIKISLYEHRVSSLSLRIQ